MIAACPLACFIHLTHGKIALVDPWWWVQIHHYFWQAKLGRGGWYAFRHYRYKGRKCIQFMHRLIMNTPKGMECHHKFRNTLDNREECLENVTPSEHSAIRKAARIAGFSLAFPDSGCCDLPMI